MSDDPQSVERAKCPYCGCGFIPSKPGQVYCSPFCEQQDAREGQAEFELNPK